MSTMSGPTRKLLNALARDVLGYNRKRAKKTKKLTLTIKDGRHGS